MIQFEEALHLVISSADVIGKEHVAMAASLGRVLAQVVVADMDIPPHRKSAMDGYACRRDGLSQEMEIIEVIPAGKVPERILGKGQCSKIMTGGVLPDGADMVIKVEDTEILPHQRVRFTGTSSADNICFQGEDIRKGEEVLLPGIVIRPQEIAILASVGCVMPLVCLRPLVGVISTGDELVEPDMVPLPSQIRNSNAAQLMAQVQQAGAIPEYFGIANDTKESLFQSITAAISKCDVVLLTGGVSMGEFDFVPEIFNSLGIEILFKSIAVQPGRPTLFGKLSGKYVFGLPGNPVSSFVQFEMLVKPLISRLMGHEFAPVIMKFPMGVTYQRRRYGRRTFLPVVIRDGKVYPVEYHGSAHIHAYTFADGILSVGINESLIEEGAMVDVRRI